MSLWAATKEMLKKMGMSKSLIKILYGSRKVDRRKGSKANAYPKHHRAKRKRLRKISKESRRRNF